MGVIRDIKMDLEQSALRLMREYYARLYADALKLCNDPTFSEDLVMQTISEVCRDTKGFDEDKGDFYSWMHGILEHLHAHAKRRLVTRGTTPVDPEELALNESLATNETDEQILKNSDDDALRKAVNRLPPTYRQAVVMHYFSEMPIKDVATLMKVPVGTIFWRLNVARKMLAKDLADKLGKKKPVAVLLAVLLGAGALFGAWQAAEAIFTPPTPTPTTTPTPTPTTLTTTTKEKPPMNKIKGTLLAATTAVSLMSTAQADEPTGPIDITPSNIESLNAGTAIKVDGDYVLSFTNTTKTYTFTIPNGVESIRYLVVAGGGSGGGRVGGGGGAGGMLENDAYSVKVGDVLTINVGAGGASQTGSGAGNNGEDSSITNGSVEVALAYGGGGGGSTQTKTIIHSANSGGSGGGSSGTLEYGSYNFSAGGSAIGSQGCKGGGDDETSSGRSACGGGGAGSEGSKGSATGAGVGGAGRSCDITGESKDYAGGGGGAGRNSTYGGANGGVGGGGKGGQNGGTVKYGAPGTDGLGGGGGGCGESGAGSGKGGDGIVIIRYLAPAAAKATIHFSHESNTATWVATAYGEEVEEGGEVDDGATITVVATPKDDYEYASAPEGWAKNADGTISANFVAKASECTIQIPAATAIPFTMNFTPGANASYTATVDGQPVQNGAKIRTGKEIVVVVTPNTDCEYAAIPEGWVAGEVEGTLTRTITAGEGVPQLTIPDATAIDYVQVQFTSNGSAFYEATNAVGGVVAGRVRAGTEVFVKIWAGVGFVYNATPTGWTCEAEGDAYTKFFTAVSGSPLTIQIPNATEISRKWTKEIPANIGYKLEVGKDLVYVFTNTTEDGCEMVLPSGVTSLRYLVVGGGGAGGQGSGCCGGGGGAGGMLTNNEFKVIGRMLKINVGKGGVGTDGCGADGEDSVLVNGAGVIRAFGGGGGGGGRSSSDIVSPNPGGSGGGGNGSPKNAQRSKILAGADAKVAEDGRTQGNAGGGTAYEADQAYLSASGGGGAGGRGDSGSASGASSKGGNGGAGLPCDITGEPKDYAGGGGGAGFDSYRTPGAGGSGIGGEGGKGANGGDGKDGTGSGGGGNGGKGGDGVVIIRFRHSGQGTLIFLM